jgi:hypothetical protein
MGAGYNRMNDLVILQTSQGLVRYLEACHAASDQGNSVKDMVTPDDVQ